MDAKDARLPVLAPVRHDGVRGSLGLVDEVGVEDVELVPLHRLRRWVVVVVVRLVVLVPLVPGVNAVEVLGLPGAVLVVPPVHLRLQRRLPRERNLTRSVAHHPLRHRPGPLLLRAPVLHRLARVGGDVLDDGSRQSRRLPRALLEGVEGGALRGTRRGARARGFLEPAELLRLLRRAEPRELAPVLVLVHHVQVVGLVLPRADSLGGERPVALGCPAARGHGCGGHRPR